MTTERLRLVGLTTSDNNGTVIQYDIDSEGSGWQIYAKSSRFKLARQLGGKPPRFFRRPGRQYMIPINLPSGNPLAAIYDTLERVGESDRFTKLSLWYDGEDSNDEVIVEIYQEGLCIGLNRRTFDEAAASRVAATVSNAIGITVTAAPEPNPKYVMITIDNLPAEDAHDEMLAFCARVAETVYTIL